VSPNRDLDASAEEAALSLLVGLANNVDDAPADPPPPPSPNEKVDAGIEAADDVSFVSPAPNEKVEAGIEAADEVGFASLAPNEKVGAGLAGVEAAASDCCGLLERLKMLEGPALFSVSPPPKLKAGLFDSPALVDVDVPNEKPALFASALSAVAEPNEKVGLVESAAPKENGGAAAVDDGFSVLPSRGNTFCPLITNSLVVG
jgi:hypothetical protein